MKRYLMLLAAVWLAILFASRLTAPIGGLMAAAERVQPPTITRIVARLEEGGLVTREIDPSDRRVARIRLSPS